MIRPDDICGSDDAGEHQAENADLAKIPKFLDRRPLDRSAPMPTEEAVKAETKTLAYNRAEHPSAGASGSGNAGDPPQDPVEEQQFDAPSSDSTIVKELGSLEQWVCWRKVDRRGNITKVPINPNTNQPASVTNPEHWTDYVTAHDSATQFGCDGIGFVFTKDDPYVGIDLDKCRDPVSGRLDMPSRQVVERLDSYTEISPSRRGLHVIVKVNDASALRGRRTKRIEIYPHGRYFTMTGDHFPKTLETVEFRDEAIEWLITTHFTIDGAAPNADGDFHSLLAQTQIEIDPFLDEDAKAPAKLETLFENEPRVRRIWNKPRDDANGWTASERDLSLTGYFLRASWSHGEIVQALIANRRERGEPPKLRADYYARTILKARRGLEDGGSPAGLPNDTGDGTPHAERRSPYQTTDLANAHRIEREFRDKLRWARGIGWLTWTGLYWEPSEIAALRLASLLGALIHAEVAETARRASTTDNQEERDEIGKIAGRLLKWGHQSENEPRIRAAMHLARPLLEIDPDCLDQDPWLLNVANGTLDLRTGNLREQQPHDFITKKLPVAFDHTAHCPLWEMFLNRIMDGNHRLIRYLQKMAGYALTGDVSEQVVFFLHGDGANGKSTFLETLGTLLGPYAHRAMPELLLAGQFDRHPTEVAALQGARLVICSEIEEGRRWASQRLKELTGEQRVTARKMRQDPVTISLTCKFLIHANHKPQVRDNSIAFWRRIRLIPFNVTVPEVDRDKHLLEKLKAELPGILNWALEGCRLWQKEGLGEPPEVAEAVAAYRGQADTVSSFIEECCVTGSEHKVQPGVLHAAYEGWTQDKGLEPANVRTFKTRLVELGFKRYEPGGYPHWKGIDLAGGAGAL